MEQTRRVFDEDAYQIACTGTVLSCKASDAEGHRGQFEVILDKTVFFPEEGGQSPDYGMLGEAEVLDVQIKNGIITHYTNAPLMEGLEVTGQINWEHRFSNMQQHSGEHIFSGLVYKHHGYHNVGFHLSDHIVSMDFDGILSEEDVATIEREVNAAIYANVPIHVLYPTKEEEKALSYRSKKEVEGQLRLVQIEGYDLCACCAPHVKRTGEIGVLKVMSRQNYKGGVRVTILCGNRALSAFCEKNRILSSLTELLTTSESEIPNSVRTLQATSKEYKAKLNLAKQALLEKELSAISDTAENVVLFEEDIESAVLRHIVNEQVTHREGYVMAFCGNDKQGYSYIIGSSKKDCKELLMRLQKSLGAKGGGSSQMIQGSVMTTRNDIERIIG